MLRGRKLRVTVGAAIVMLGLGVSSMAAFGVTPTASVSPHQNLTNGQKVWVSGANFPPGATVAIVQCNAKAATQGQNGCDTSHPRIVSVTAFGRVPARSYLVVKGTIGTGTGAAPCDHAHPCAMVVADIAAQTIHAVAPIFFAP
jgi:hypothetical protein